MIKSMEEKRVHGSFYCTLSDAELVKAAARAEDRSVTYFVTLAALEKARAHPVNAKTEGA